VREKYFSRRAIGVHLALVAWLAMCASAAWWQVGRAIQGNSLSFLYAIEWPLFAVLGFLGWFALLNLEKVTEGQRRAREEYEEMMRDKAQAERAAAASEEDPALAAYNDHLADLARKPKRNMFGH
jgi:DNA-binding transcriptional regulator of glucitol operon